MSRTNNKQNSKKQSTNLRLWVQVLFTALTNGYVLGFAEGKIFRGPSKMLCVPGLNCYSCPGALASCPIGSLQAVIGDRKYNMSFYIIGFLMIFGALVGRFVCGFLCPFGLMQDLLYKIPVKRKLLNPPGDRWLRYLKYGVLLIFVILLPLLLTDFAGLGTPWFCKLICPSGTLLGGLPLVSTNPALQSTIGFLFSWKVSILVIILLASIFIGRPFCRYLCPLGALYGLFNRFSLYRYTVDPVKCIGCNRCHQNCIMGIKVYEKPNQAECIRCGKCVGVCPTGAVSCPGAELLGKTACQPDRKKPAKQDKTAS